MTDSNDQPGCTFAETVSKLGFRASISREERPWAQGDATAAFGIRPELGAVRATVRSKTLRAAFDWLRKPRLFKRRAPRAFRLREAARVAGLDEETCAEYLGTFVGLGLLDRIGHLYLPVRRRDSHINLMATRLWTDIDLCFRAAKALQVFRLDEAADWTGLDEKTCAEHLEAFIQLGMLACTGDLYHPIRRSGDRLKVMTVTCLWDDARGIVGEPTIEEAKR
jgi:hypothetical protein